MKRISIFMDVEDPINPLADDAALDFAHLFTDYGVRASFCLTGEKCRTLLSRGRHDVLEAYNPHCLGLHTDTHSFHPSTMELLADLNFADGCEAAFEAESKGFKSFVEAFGREPAFWGGAGNTWSPEITDAIKRLQIPAYSYAQTRFPGEAVHKFNGVVALPQALSISELDWADEQRSKLRSREVLESIETISQPWLGVFVGHPTKFRHTQYWDTPYFHGRTPQALEYTALHPLEIYLKAKENLADFLLAAKKQFDVVGVDDSLSLPWEFRAPSSEEMDFFKRETSEALTFVAKWPVHRQGLDPALIIAKTLALASTAKIGFLKG